MHTLPLGGTRDSYLYVPNEAGSGEAPLVLLLHGAGGHAHDGLRVLLHLAERRGLLLVAPASTAATRDIIAGRRYGPDLALLDAALAYVFAHGTYDPILAIDPCSRNIVRQLTAQGYPLRYREFDGGHGIPPEVAEEALAWFRA